MERPKVQAAVERANLLIEQAVALGEPPEDPLLLFLVLYGFWMANLFAANCDLCRELAEHTLTLAEKQKALVPLVIGHRMMAITLSFIGAPAQSRIALRSSPRSLRPCQASFTGYAIWH